MAQRLLGGFLGLLMAAAIQLPAQAQSAETEAPELVVNPDVSLEYVVKKGDTLWDISAYYLRDPWLWPELWNANPQVANPHLIYPGEILYLVWIDGKPRLQREPLRREPPQARNFARLSPQVRASALETAIPTIPLSAIRAFLNGPRVIDPKEYKSAPYVLAFEDEHLVGADGLDTYIRRASEDNGYRYNVVRLGQEYRDPETKRLLGHEAIPIATAEIQQFGPVSVAQTNKNLREILIGDRLLPISFENFDSNFYPHAPDFPVNGQIISVVDGVTQIGQFQIVTLNRGSDHDIEAGHVLRVMQRGAVVKDPFASQFDGNIMDRLYGKRTKRDKELHPVRGRVRLPDHDAGLLMVFKTFDKISYGLIMKATKAIHVLDKVTNPDIQR